MEELDTNQLLVEAFLDAERNDKKLDAFRTKLQTIKRWLRELFSVPLPTPKIEDGAYREVT